MIKIENFIFLLEIGRPFCRSHTNMFERPSIVFRFLIWHHIGCRGLWLHATNNKNLCLVNVKPTTDRFVHVSSSTLPVRSHTHTRKCIVFRDRAFLRHTGTPLVAFVFFSCYCYSDNSNNAENETTTYITERASFAFFETCIFTNSIFFFCCSIRSPISMCIWCRGNAFVHSV